MAESSSKSQAPSVPTPSTGLTAATSISVKNPSCLQCRKRKIKCDRKYPCSNCVKSNAECVFRDSIPSRHHKRKAEFVLLSRLKHYESLLRQHGIDPGVHNDSIITSIDATSAEVQHQMNALDVSDAETRPHSVHKDSEATTRPLKGRIFKKGGKSLYLENDVWSTLGSELEESDCIPDDNDADSGGYLSPSQEVDAMAQDNGYHVLFAAPSNESLTSLHPEPVHIFKLWQIFLENVNALTKVIHAPTVQQQILNVVGNMSSIGKPLEALLFSIYCCALLSLTDEEVATEFNEDKNAMQARFHAGTQRALAKAGAMKTSDLVVLQAFCLYIVSCRSTYDRRILWCLSGVTMRIAQQMGLHRDGSQLGLSVFETEMRRRVWWHIIYMDRTVARTYGFVSAPLPASDVHLPLSVDDSELHPNMKEIPAEREHPGTDMLHCQLRQEFGKWQDRRVSFVESMFAGNTVRSPPNSTDQAVTPEKAEDDVGERQKNVTELEQTLQHKILRFCDPSIPLHVMVKHSAHAIISTLALVAYHPLHLYGPSRKLPPLTESERNRFFSICMDIGENNKILRNTDSLKRFPWHLDWHVPWPALLYMFSEMSQRSILLEETQRAWDYLDVLFMPQFERLRPEARSPLHIVCLRLATKAWNAHINECQHLGIPAPPCPRIVDMVWNHSSLSKNMKGNQARFRDGSIESSSVQTSPPQEQQPQQWHHYKNQSTTGQSLPQQDTLRVGDGLGFQQINLGNFQLPDYFGDHQQLPLNDGLTMNWNDWDPIFQQLSPTLGMSRF